MTRNHEMTTATPVKDGTRYARRRREAIRTGTWQGLVPVEVVREHLDTLRARGLSLRAIAAAAGIPESTLQPILHPPHASKAGYRHVHGPTAAALLRVQPGDAPDWACVFVVGSRRRVEALMWRGWSGVYLGQRLGMTHQAVYSIRTRADRITAFNARRIAALFDELETKDGPSAHTRTRALRAGYAPPAAWDEDTIDDPDAQPFVAAEVPRDADDVDEVAVLRAVAHGATHDDLTIAERRTVVEQLARAGWSDAEVGEWLGVTARTVERDRKAWSIPSRWAA